MTMKSITSFFPKAPSNGQGKKTAIRSQISVEKVEQINRLSEQLSPKCSSKSQRTALHSYLNMATDEQLALIEKIAGVSEIMDNVQNVAKFVRGVMTLNGDIYGTVDIGERKLSAKGMLMFRDALSQHVSKESIRSKRAILVAWSLWKDASSDVFIEESRVVAYFKLAGLDPEEAISHLKKHPSMPGMYTLPSLETQQKNIDWMLATSSIISSAVLPGVEAIGDLDEVQAYAVKNALNKPVSFLHGSAGTGKTKTISAIIKTILDCKDDNVTMVCTAFTHKAVKCIEERIIASGIPLEDVVTCTIDSLIGKLDMENMNRDTSASSTMAPSAKKPMFSEKLYIVLDEASMISLKLLSRLAVSLRTNDKSFQLCMVGDIGQLRPIDRGEMFRHIVKSCESMSSKLSTRLDVCYRTSFFDLYNVCTQVRNGSFPESSSEHFQLLACHDEDDITRNLVKCIKAHGTNAQYLAWKNEDVVMISNMVQKWLLTCKQKPIGTIVLDISDSYLQRHYLPRGGYADVKYHVGDRVVFSGNKYKEVSRATLGTVTRILKKGKDSVGISVLWDGHGNEMEHRYDKINVTAPPPKCATHNNNSSGGEHDDDDSDESENNMAFMLAYCMTVHKSQGSEFQRVVVACYAMAMQRNFEDRRWLYTAMSRGKENITVIGIPKDMIAFTQKPIPHVPVLDIATPI